MTTPKNDWEERLSAIAILRHGEELGETQWVFLPEDLKSFIRAEKESSFKEGQEDMLSKVRKQVLRIVGVHESPHTLSNCRYCQIEKSLTHLTNQ
jgi:hypothetical protein